MAVSAPGVDVQLPGQPAALRRPPTGRCRCTAGWATAGTCRSSTSTATTAATGSPRAPRRSRCAAPPATCSGFGPEVAEGRGCSRADARGMCSPAQKVQTEVDRPIREVASMRRASAGAPELVLKLSAVGTGQPSQGRSASWRWRVLPGRGTLERSTCWDPPAAGGCGADGLVNDHTSSTSSGRGRRH